MLVFQVLIRMRPLSSIEAANQEFLKCLRQESAHTVTWLGQPESQFTFDHVAGEKISQVSNFLHNLGAELEALFRV